MADAGSANGDLLNRNSGGDCISDTVSGISPSGEGFGMKGDMEIDAPVAPDKAGDYVRELLNEKQRLDSSQWPHALRLLDQEVTKEVARIQSGGKPLPKESKYVDIYREKPIRVAVKVLVPIKEHPKFNFVGKLLGPKGNSMKRLQEDTMTKMAVLGRGSMKDKQKEEELRMSMDPKYAHLSDDLHVEIAAYAPPAEAHARIAYALAEVRKYLIPDSNDEIRQEQMREMEMIQTVTGEPGAGSNNGTPPGSVRKSSRGGPAGRGRGGLSLRGGGVAAMRGGLPPPLRGGGRGLLAPPSRGPVGLRKPMPPPQALLPRPTPTKTKVLSILERARAAMEEASYGCCDDDMTGGGAGAGGFYDAPGYDSYNATGYSGYDDYEEGGDYYDSSEGYPGPDDAGSRWKGFKSPATGVASDRSRFRTAPYTRPTK